MKVSMYHCLLGEYFRAKADVFFARSHLNSSSHTSKYSSSSTVNVVTFLAFTKLYTSCNALLRIVTSASFTQFTMIER